MRLSRILAVISLFALLGALTACSGGGAGSADLVEHADPVPDGMPVMYEFFTST